MLPKIDVTDASDVLELITAAYPPGTPTEIAELPGASFCDTAAARAEPRLAISPDQALSRIIQLTGLSAQIPSYPLTPW